MDFGVFVCSSCSGIHRELNHKVKGIAMCNFNDKEIEILTKNGNEVWLTFINKSFQNAYKILMAGYKAAVYPEPDRRDTVKMKEFFNLKYKQRRFAQNEADDSDSEDSDEDDKKKKKKKEEKKPKKKKVEDSGSESDSVEEKKKDGGGKGLGKLIAPPGKKATTSVIEKQRPPVV